MPGGFTCGVAPGWIVDLIGRSSVDPKALKQARLLRDVGALNDGLRCYTLATYALLHGSWVHVGLNSVWLVAFGPPVARRFGPVRFTLFFFVTAIAGALAQWAFAPFEGYPVIGASAADSGLMAAGGALHFPARRAAQARRHLRRQCPRARGSRRCAELMTDRRALVFFAIWMATNFLFGAGAGALGALGRAGRLDRPCRRLCRRPAAVRPVRLGARDAGKHLRRCLESKVG